MPLAHHGERLWFKIEGADDDNWTEVESYLKVAFHAEVIDRPFDPGGVYRCNLKIRGVQYHFAIDNMFWVCFTVKAEDEPAARAFAEELDHEWYCERA
jgi:hypothetical protein